MKELERLMDALNNECYLDGDKLMLNGEVFTCHDISRAYSEFQEIKSFIKVLRGREY